MWLLKATCRWMTVINPIGRVVPNPNEPSRTKRLMTRNCCRTNGMYSWLAMNLVIRITCQCHLCRTSSGYIETRYRPKLILLPVWDYVVLWRGNWCVYLQGLRGWCGYTLTYFILCEYICVLSRDCGIDSWLWYANNQQTTSKQPGNALCPHKEVTNAMIFSIS